MQEDEPMMSREHRESESEAVQRETRFAQSIDVYPPDHGQRTNTKVNLVFGRILLERIGDT